jgi:hypothetical protein
MNGLMMKILFAAALVVSGCSKKSETTASGPSCAEAVSKAVGAMPGGPGGGEVQAKLTTIMTARCTEDKWPAAVVTCYATTVTDMASMKKCREMLPQDQQTKLMTEIRSVMMGAAAAGGGGPMHGGGAPSGGGEAPGGEAPAGSAAAPAGSAAAPTGSAADPATGSN